MSTHDVDSSWQHRLLWAIPKTASGDNVLEVYYENALYKVTFDIDNWPA